MCHDGGESVDENEWRAEERGSGKGLWRVTRRVEECDVSSVCAGGWGGNGNDQFGAVIGSIWNRMVCLAHNNH